MKSEKISELKEKEFYTIMELVQIPHLNTEAMIRSDGVVFIKRSDANYYNRDDFFTEISNVHISMDYIEELNDLFDSITKYAKEKYNL